MIEERANLQSGYDETTLEFVIHLRIVSRSLISFRDSKGKASLVAAGHDSACRLFSKFCLRLLFTKRDLGIRVPSYVTLS
jgi:hypothetical protein